MIEDELRSLYLYSEWADARAIGSLRTLTAAQYEQVIPGAEGAVPSGGWPSARATFVHLAGATDAWARRFAGEDVTVLPREDELPGLEDAAALLTGAHPRLAAFVETLTPERKSGPFTWKNLQGAERTAPLWAVLRHVVNHGTYHRGQLSALLRRLGAKPVPTDMVLWGIELWESGKAR